MTIHTLASVARYLRRLTRALDARDAGKIPYMVEDSIGRQRVLVLMPGEVPPDGGQELLAQDGAQRVLPRALS